MASQFEPANETNAQTFSKLDTYPWDTDAEFQTGLRAILSSATTPSQIPPLTLRARCFYYNRKYPTTPVDFEAYSRHVSETASMQVQPQLSSPPTSSNPPGEELLSSLNSISSQPLPPPHPSAATEAAAVATTTPEQPQYPQSFASLISLIQSGAPIPGIREIPDTVLEGAASEPVEGRRRKPWEREENEVVEGTFGDRRDDRVVQEFPVEG